MVLDVVREDDIPSLFDWTEDCRALGLWHMGNPQRSLEVFRVQMRRMLAGTNTFIIRRGGTGAPVGLVQLYDVSLENGWAFYFQYMAPEYRQHVFAAEAALLFVDQVFAQTSLRKIYADVYEYNDLALRSLLNAGCKEEGRFREFAWHDGRYWDCYRLSLSRDDWVVLRDRMIWLIDMEQYLAVTLPVRPRMAGFSDGSK